MPTSLLQHYATRIVAVVAPAVGQRECDVQPQARDYRKRPTSKNRTELTTPNHGTQLGQTNTSGGGGAARRLKNRKAKLPNENIE
ncbi:MAG: hypothetical protein ACR2PG_12930, partial [Hyphomicrobiaceae bacterium]